MFQSIGGSHSPPPSFVLPPTIREYKWRDDIFLDHRKKRMSVEISRHANFGSLDPDLYRKGLIPECEEIVEDYLPEECRGRLWMKFAYDPHEECLVVALIRLRFVPKRLDETAPDVMVGLTLLPNERRQFNSRTYEATTDRDFAEDEANFVFQVPKMLSVNSDWALRVRLFDATRRCTPIGGALVPLAPLIASLLTNEAEPSTPTTKSSSPSKMIEDSNNEDSGAATGNEVPYVVRCLDMHQVTNEQEDQISFAGPPKQVGTSTPPTPSSPSTNLVRKILAMNSAFQQQLAAAGIVESRNGHPHHHHSGIVQMSFCFSSAANRLSISVHQARLTCLINAHQVVPDATSETNNAVTEDEHASLEAYAKFSLFEHGNRELKSKRTRTVRAEKIISNRNTSPHSPSIMRHGHVKEVGGNDHASDQCEHELRFIELVVLKDLPDAEHLLNNCGLRIQINKTSLVSRDKPICRSFIGSAIFCRSKELSNWEEIITSKQGEPLTFQIRLSPVVEQQD